MVARAWTTTKVSNIKNRRIFVLWALITISFATYVARQDVLLGSERKNIREKLCFVPANDLVSEDSRPNYLYNPTWSLIAELLRRSSPAFIGIKVKKEASERPEKSAPPEKKKKNRCACTFLAVVAKEWTYLLVSLYWKVRWSICCFMYKFVQACYFCCK